MLNLQRPAALAKGSAALRCRSQRCAAASVGAQRGVVQCRAAAAAVGSADRVSAALAAAADRNQCAPALVPCNAARERIDCAEPPPPRRCRVALIPFVCAGDPNLETTKKALRVLDEARGLPAPTPSHSSGWGMGEQVGCVQRPHGGAARTCAPARAPRDAAALGGHAAWLPGSPWLRTRAPPVQTAPHLQLPSPGPGGSPRSAQVGVDVIELGVPYSDPLAGACGLNPLAAPPWPPPPLRLSLARRRRRLPAQMGLRSRRVRTHESKTNRANRTAARR